MKPPTSHSVLGGPDDGRTPGIAEEHARWELDRFLPYRLSVLSNRLSQTIAGAYARRFGLGITEWRVIAVLGRYPGLSANAVAARTAMDKVAVSRTVARLLERGLLQRDIHDDDRRRSVLELSADGYGIYDESCRSRWTTNAACSLRSTPRNARSWTGCCEAGRSARR